jgi:hypothetical protein
MSGLSHTPGKRAWGYSHRGFESRLFRQNQSDNYPKSDRSFNFTSFESRKKATFRWLFLFLLDALIQCRFLAVLVNVQSDGRIFEFAVGFKGNGGRHTFEIALD